jgi:hypothetical protein
MSGQPKTSLYVEHAVDVFKWILVTAGVVAVLGGFMYGCSRYNDSVHAMKTECIKQGGTAIDGGPGFNGFHCVFGKSK